MDNTTLTHWGIKGMKWGVRRYQNKDGSLTPAGKKRMYGEIFDAEAKDAGDRKKYTADANRWVKEDMTRSKQVAEQGSQLANKLKNANDNAMRNQPKAKMDLSHMTDKQMRDEINRAILERQYNDMFAPQKANKGREYVSKILETTGTVLAIGSSALGLALAIREFRNK